MEESARLSETQLELAEARAQVESMRREMSAQTTATALHASAAKDDVARLQDMLDAQNVRIAQLERAAAGVIDGARDGDEGDGAAQVGGFTGRGVNTSNSAGVGGCTSTAQHC